MLRWLMTIDNPLCSIVFFSKVSRSIWESTGGLAQFLESQPASNSVFPGLQLHLLSTIALLYLTNPRQYLLCLL